MATPQELLQEPLDNRNELQLHEKHPDLDVRELDHVIFPQDSYSDGTYWADLPLLRRWKWINNQQNAEASRELKLLWTSFKNDPLQPVRSYFSEYVVAGLGLFVEGYVLFSIGNLEPLFAAVWPGCWGTKPTECNLTWVRSVTYLEIVGIILGQIIVGIIGDYLGRRWGLVQDALIMFTGTILLTASWGASLEGWVIMYAISLLWYGIGVGGEYPMTATSSMERKGGLNSSTEDKLHRGRKVQLAFLMQGWGQLANQGLLIICLLIFHSGSAPPYTETSTQYTFRVQFAIVGLVTLWLAYYRFYKVQYADAALKQAKKKSQVTGYDIVSLKLTSSHYWHRLVGTCGTWYANDIFFYGNKIFQAQFISAITHKSGPDVVFTNWLWNLVNIGVSLCGYYLAAFMIDNKFYGRKTMQQVGFMADFILFVVAAALYPYLSTDNVKAFQAIYFLSSFFQQFGPNATTFLLAAEVYPSPIRATAHGLSAAFGKLGALTATIAYNYIDTRTKIWVVCWFGLLGAFLTWAFVPDTTGVDLQEQERYWNFVRRGRPEMYHGIAVHPRHLSNYEIYVLGRHKNYNAELDTQMKIDELRTEYNEICSLNEKEGCLDDSDAGDVNAKVKNCFDKENEMRSSKTKTTNSDTSSVTDDRAEKQRQNTDSLLQAMNKR